MSWKLIVVGGITLYLVSFALGFITGPLIHNGVLLEPYQATASVWQPALQSVPPDMEAILPTWIRNGVIWGFVVAGLFGRFRAALEGAPWRKGLIFGLCLGIFTVATFLQWSGIFDLPAKIWMWWSFESLISLSIAGTALGVVAGKVAPEEV